MTWALKAPPGGGKQGANPYFDGLSIEEQEDIANKHIEMDEKFNFYRLKNTPQNTPETGWLINMHTTTIFTEGSNKRAFSALDMYFLRENGSHFKATMKYEPYFYIAVTEGMEGVFDQWVKNKFKSEVSAVSVIEKEDLDLKNHLIGLKRTLVKIEFPNTNDLMRVRKVLMPAIKRNQDEAKTKAIYEVYKPENTNTSNKMNNDEVLEHVLDIREYDVPYHIRTAIDNSITCGLWYDVQVRGLSTTLTHREDLEERPDPVIMAFDIECTKQDLKFPDADNGDMVMMISYMLDNQGYLIINRDVVSADIEDFEYTPKPDYEGPFIVWNEPDERALLQRFFDHIIEVQPTILVTFNGDFFDWPFIDKRAAYYGMNMTEQIGFGKDNADEYKSRHAIHMDAFSTVGGWSVEDMLLVSVYGMHASAPVLLLPHTGV
ncbi:hypothetical protein SARC_08984 [Sphaeroforma arctica JP610]|uniref:DNA polymerase epsilon catalytic subunit n=1 Tax=Sphaeroforma arctica JP610 TaxID=667725 RepID=A0A0L0FQ11_9EUKA|nr:hypothetical protein SARC_08984 [Sphaeroforma arctica JP610]KNC78596.1 hypothetical protein SARC_08984 [Sphaeroforma arctica JP610]|eukprot:XP_014152498.1 hypothetical protein SARC_08984 [Sphaeroforma arctica JP610]